jgi:glyceraldehyde 3-phosphate dehydrogenase
MSIKVGINGFGRIGQAFLRILASSPDVGVEVVAINDVGAIDTLAYSLTYDSIRGRFDGSIVVEDNDLIINDRRIRVFASADPAHIPWGDVGVDVVLEATGRFRKNDDARAHITHGGARKVIVSASADNPDAFLVWGANEETYNPTMHHVVSPASCGVNALAVMAKVLSDAFGLHAVNTTVVLAAQGWQKIHDTVQATSRDDPRLGRSASVNIIPHTYVAGDLLATALPQLGDVRYSYYVVPTPIGSLAILAGQTHRPVQAEEVNRVMRQAAEGRLKGVLDYDHNLTVSSDVTGNPASCLFDPTGTQTTPDGGLKVMGWFDGEWGFASRLINLAKLVGTHEAA